MITINPIKLNKIRHISFGEGNLNNIDSKVGLISLDKNASNKINFEKDLYISRKADAVQSNPIKAIGYNIVKAYNILRTPKNNTIEAETNYIHIPYMA